MFIKADSHVTYQSTCVTKEINQSQISRKVGVTSKLNFDVCIWKRIDARNYRQRIWKIARGITRQRYFSRGAAISVRSPSFPTSTTISTRLVELTEPSQDVLSIFSFVETASGELGIPKQLTDKR